MKPELTAYFESVDTAIARAIHDFKPRLQLPAVHAMCQTKEEYDDAIGDRFVAGMVRQKYQPARDIFFKDLERPSAHVDREVTAAIRFAIYRFGGVSLQHMWESIKPFFPKQTWRQQKGRCAGVERYASRECREAIYLFVVRTVHRTGGLGFWRKNSRFHDRYDVFEAGYDELPQFCDRKVYSEERKSVGFENIHAVDTNPATMDESDPRHAYKLFNKVRFLVNCEAAYHFLLDGPDGEPCLWATRMIWKNSAQSPEVYAIEGLPASLMDIPGVPFGQEGQYERRRTAPINPPMRLGR